jgi:hypothetical protein
MRIVELIRAMLSPRLRLLRRLAEIAGDAELLAENLTRHTSMCNYANLRTGLEEVAAAETAQAIAIRQLLLENGTRPQVAAQPPHDGSSNWERLRNDLALQIKILRALQFQLSEWTSIDSLMAERLRESAREQDRYIGQLRDLTLKCDPQALN